MRQTLATLTRPPRHAIAWPGRAAIAVGAALAVIAVLAAMILLDARLVALAAGLSPRLVEFFQRVTRFGESGWFLWPLGLALLALAALDRPEAPRWSRLVLAAWGTRLGFIFTAIAVPGLFVSIAKRLIGRARPLTDGGDIWSYHFAAWRVEYAALPSGHATTAFAALVAIGAVVPEARALLWIYAVVIAASRVALQSHHPSDVIAGAIVGSLGALLVRHWFAGRRLAFTVTPAGRVRALPGPGIRRIGRAIAGSLRSVASPVA